MKLLQENIYSFSAYKACNGSLYNNGVFTSASPVSITDSGMCTEHFTMA